MEAIEISGSKLEELRLRLEENEKRWDQMNALGKVVGTLNMRLQHDTMIPLGPLAFTPAKLVRTNEVLVDLGAGFFTWQTCYQAHTILTRRQRDLVQEMEGIKQSIAAIETALDSAGEDREEPTPLVQEEETKEFRLSLEEAEAFHSSIQSSQPVSQPVSNAEHAKVMQLFSQLAGEEACLQEQATLHQPKAKDEPLQVTGSAEKRTSPDVIGSIVERAPPSVPSAVSQDVDNTASTTTATTSKRVSLFKQKRQMNNQ